MNSVIEIQLDTTPPKVEIYAPNYYTIGTEMEITIQADEQLDYYYESYIEDRNGNRYNLNLKHEGDKFIGNVKLLNVSQGIMNVVAVVRDEVHNVSEKISKQIRVFPKSELLMETDIKTLDKIPMIKERDKILREIKYSM